jgi:hypothetical protein
MLFAGEDRKKVTKKLNMLFVTLQRKLSSTVKYCSRDSGSTGLWPASFS